MQQTVRARLFATCTLALAVITLAASTGHARSASPVSTESPADQSIQLSKSAAAEISALLGAGTYSRETANLLVQLVLSHDGGAFAGKRVSRGGWCWNEDGTFYGSLPCPKEIMNRDRAGSAKSMTKRAARPLVLRKGLVSKPVSNELDRLLTGGTFSKEAAIALVQLAHEKGSGLPGFHKGGGWCWNDDWTFHGSLPCPK
ncbi:MAG: hypothetical protein ACYC5V_01295 [Gemmatimonadaceae bacterium]